MTPRTAHRSVLPLAVAAFAAGGILLAPAASAAGSGAASARPTSAPRPASTSVTAVPAPRGGGIKAGVPTASPSPARDRFGSGRQVGTVPRGGAQAGQGATGPSTTMMIGGAGIAAAGAAALGFAVLRRRAGAQG